MPKGKVKYFNDPRGWGIITDPDKKQDVYVHYSNINMDGYRTLKVGQEVSYDLSLTDDGARAQNVMIVE